jgi:hypothetical protein
MSDPVSLRNIPSDALKLAHTLSAQTGLSLNAVFRLALASGLLVEATRVTPGPDGKLAGWEGSALAKALRRHLGSAIDLLMEHGEHPYGATMSNENKAPSQSTSGTLMAQEKGRPLENGIEDDLDALGIGFGLSEALEDDR